MFIVLLLYRCVYVNISVRYTFTKYYQISIPSPRYEKYTLILGKTLFKNGKNHNSNNNTNNNTSHVNKHI